MASLGQRMRARLRLIRRNPPLRMPWTLRKLGVLGMNQRNGDYIGIYNPRRFYPLVDDKLKTKQLALEAGIDTPELYGVIEIEHQIRDLDTLLGNHQDFVIKPANGSGGNGIMVISGRRGVQFIRASGATVSRGELEHFISNVLSGMYSLGGLPDKAIIEYRVKPHAVFDTVSYQGVPDIRTIVFRGVPIAAMVRLPTRQSDGKANLHQGAIGAGIDLATGRTVDGVWFNSVLDSHPDSGNVVRGIEVPEWDKLLELSARSYDLTGLGYLGVDVVLDRDHGPLILEYNARPGLNIQLANQMGLLNRLEKVRALDEIPASAAERVALGKRLFGE
ncbi:alpha-L-glutamate ligase-like protein [Salinisphaera aquimarina]|uniref:Alpha-L-glutamate ligase-like protein n=1 Tax=Salinisphaera aquimarina TaxID=2094031 RepID=A0ABV7EST2_9GAMM